MIRSKVIEEYKKSLRLTKEQREVLIGLLLGDGCLESMNNGKTYRLLVEQSIKNKEYVMHLYDLFKPWVLSEPKVKLPNLKGYSRNESIVFKTVSHGSFRFYDHQFYELVNGKRKKKVPRLIHKWLTSRSMAYWYMDDGGLKSKETKGVLLHTEGFIYKDVDFLLKCLDEVYNIKGSKRKSKDGWQLYIKAESSDLFFKNIEKYILKEFYYKIPRQINILPKE